MSILGKLRPDRLTRLLHVEVGAAEQAIGFTERANLVRIKATALQAYLVDTPNLGRVAVRDHERWNVLDDFRATAGDGESSDPAKLMYGCEASHYRVVSNVNVSGQCAVIGKNDVVANSAIVSDMTICEKISVVADPRFAFAGCAAVHGHEFAKRVFVADLKIRRFAAIF